MYAIRIKGTAQLIASFYTKKDAENVLYKIHDTAADGVPLEIVEE